MPSLGELQYLPGARDVLARERRRLEAEAEAFREFGDRLDSLSPAPPETAGGKPARRTDSLVLSSAGSASLDRVRETYRETVMDVPHFEDDYDESLETNVAEEFGSEIAQAVTSRQTLTPPLKQSMLSAARAARNSRTDLLAELDDEAETLRDAETRLGRLAGSVPAVPGPLSNWSFETLIGVWEEFATLEAEYDRLCRERQAQLHARRRRLRTPDEAWLCDYVYDGFDVTHPVLADAVEQIDSLRTRRRRVRSLLARLD